MIRTMYELGYKYLYDNHQPFSRDFIRTCMIFRVGEPMPESTHTCTYTPTNMTNIVNSLMFAGINVFVHHDKTMLAGINVCG